MRKATMIATTLIAVLALSVGAFAYPAVVGTHPLSAVHSGSPVTATHPKTGDNSTDNGTSDNETGDHQTAPVGNETDNETADNETAPVPPMPEANETENETDMSNISVEHNVTVTQEDNTTWVNGTIMVDNGTATLVDFTFALVVHDNGTANVTINDTTMVGSELITVHGFAVYSADRHVLEVFGVARGAQNSTVLWERTFAFEAPSDCSYGA
ncbi:MAG TPA: hypothetical protein HA326_01015 [Thermoplasmata archaeon]|nr:hypothetical protein [Thermoplasmata archaeon]